MRRRTLLSTLGGGAALLAGCRGLGEPSTTDTASRNADRSERSGSTDSTQTDGERPTGGMSGTTSAGATPADATPTETAEPADVTVERAWLQYGVVTTATADSIGISYPETPYLGVSLRVDGTVPTGAFALAVGDERYGPSTVDRLYRTSWGDSVAYDPLAGGGLLLFEPPRSVPDGTRVSLTWPGGEHTVDDGIGARLDGTVPQLSVSLDVPATHDGPGAPPISVDVTNEDDAPARFLGALNRAGPRVASTPVARLTERVPAGETVTIAVDDSWHGLPGTARIGDGDPDVTYRLDHAATQAMAQIRIVESA